MDMCKINKVCVVTGSRAEYGLLFWIIKGIKEAEDLELQLAVTGMHLGVEFGNTYECIIKDGFTIDYKVDSLMSSDTPVGVSKSIGLGVIGFADAFDMLKPDLVVVLGDRFEIFAAVTAAHVRQTPVAHIHGGELTEGSIDDAFRHSITKMSQLHFASTETYRKRLLQLGEQPEKVFNVGAPGVEYIKNLKCVPVSEIESAIGLSLKKSTILVTLHPETKSQVSIEDQVSSLLAALDEMRDIQIVFTKSNSDVGGRYINSEFERFVDSNSQRSVMVASLGQEIFLSLHKYIRGVVGNSSSGIIESPYFSIGSVTLGKRQLGRVREKLVIPCEFDKKNILSSIDRMLEKSFVTEAGKFEFQYGDGDVSSQVLSRIRDFLLSPELGKTFIDLRQ